MTVILLVPANAPRDAPRIGLTQGLFAVVDPADVQMLIRYKWSAHRASHGNGVFWYARAWIDGRRKMMHTLLTGWRMVDHHNGNGLDNRRANLRRASRSQNMGNRQKLMASSSRYKGVSWQKGVEKWKAQIGYDGRRIYLGIYATEEEAARAYDDAARHYFGEFAAVNFPLSSSEHSAFQRGAL